MTRNRLMGLLVAAILVVGCLIPIACGDSSSSIAGEYVNQSSPADHLELKSNGSYSLLEDGMSFEGNWKVSGDKITLTWMGFESVGTIEGNKLIDNEGQVWVKK